MILRQEGPWPTRWGMWPLAAALFFGCGGADPTEGADPTDPPGEDPTDTAAPEATEPAASTPTASQAPEATDPPTAAPTAAGPTAAPTPEATPIRPSEYIYTPGPEPEPSLDTDTLGRIIGQTRSADGG